jgi:Icc protein
MGGARLTRREALAAAGAGAVALTFPEPLLSAVLPVSPPGGGLKPELLTVTQRGFAAWWMSPAPTDTIVRVWRADGSGGTRELRLARNQTVHAAEVEGLRPGTAYRYELRSGNKAVPRSAENPEEFRTLPQLQGRRLATIAVLNDLHVGEHCSGTATNVGGNSVPPCFTGDDYAWRMSRAALAEVRRLRPDLVILNGDLTDRGRPDEVSRALELLRGTGRPALVTRGNHDRRFHDADAECGGDGDCLRSQAFAERPPGDHALTSVARVGRRVAVVGLDSCDPESGDGRLDLGGQLAWLDTTLTQLRREGRKVIVCFHHHVANQANATHPPPLVFGVRADRGGLDALRVIGAHDVPLTLHGHTHRNFLARDPLAPRTWFLENGATKEYPAGYALLHVHEDGIVRTFHRPVDPFTRDWTRTSAGQIWGMQPDYTRGTLASRSFVLRFDGRRGDASPAPSLFGPLGLPGSRKNLLQDALKGAGAALRL